MAFRDDIADDLSLVCDNLEDIVVKLNRPSPETVTVENANRSALKKANNVFSGVNIEEGDLNFQFQVNAFKPVHNDADIQLRDTITDSDGNIYIVQASQLIVMQTVWSVMARLKS